MLLNKLNLKKQTFSNDMKSAAIRLKRGSKQEEELMYDGLYQQWKQQ